MTERCQIEAFRQLEVFRYFLSYHRTVFMLETLFEFRVTDSQCPTILGASLVGLYFMRARI